MLLAEAVFGTTRKAQLQKYSAVYILENTHAPTPGGKYQRMSFGAKNLIRGREKKVENGKKKEEWGRKREQGR